MMQTRNRHNVRNGGHQGQAALEFALILAVSVGLFLLLVPLLKLTFQQKTQDIHARAQAYMAFDHGKNTNEVNLEGVYLPVLSLGSIIPNVPGFTWPDIGDLPGMILNGLMGDLFNFLGFSTPDGILGNAMYQSGMSYVTSGFDPEAAKMGAVSGAIGSAQFGRFLDSQWNRVFGDGSVEWSDKSLQDDWGAEWVAGENGAAGKWGGNIAVCSDVAGSCTQGFMSGYVTSGGSMTAGIVDGLGSGWMVKANQQWMENTLGSDFWVGVTNGGVKGSLQVAGGASDPLATIAISAAGGGMMSKTVQGYLFGTDASGKVLKGTDVNFFRGMLGTGVNAGAMGGMAYVGSGQKDPTMLLMGAGIAVSMYAVGYGYEASGAKAKVQEATETVAEKSGWNDVMETKDKAVQAVSDTVKSGTDSVAQTVGLKDDPAAPKTDTAPAPEGGTQVAYDGGQHGAAPTAIATPTDLSTDKGAADQALAAATQVKGDSVFSYAVAAGALAAAVFLVADDKTDQGNGHNNNAADSASTSAPLPLAADAAAKNNSAKKKLGIGKGNQQETSLSNSGVDLGNLHSNGEHFNYAALSQNSKLSGFSGNVSGSLQTRTPQDINVPALAKSPLVQELKAHRNQAVDMVKIGVVRRLMFDYRQQLIQSGKSSDEASILLQDPATLERMQRAVEDPRVAETINTLVDDTLNDDNFSETLEKVRDERTREQALEAQLKLRALEREKTSRDNIFSLPDSTDKLSILEKLTNLSRKLGERI